MSEEASRFKEFERSLVQVLVNGQSSGTGVVLAPGWILTCLHVVVPQSLKEPDRAPLDMIDFGARFDVRFFALTRKAGADLVPGTEDASDDSGQLLTAEASDQTVFVHTDILKEGAAYDLVLLRWCGALPEGVKAATLSHAGDQEDEPFRCRGFPDRGRLEDLLAKGKVTGDVNYDGHPHWQLENGDIRGGLSGAPLYHPENGKVLGLVRANVRPSEDWRNLTAAHGVQVRSILSVLKLVPDFAELLSHNEAHAAAERRLEDQVGLVLRGDKEFSTKLAACVSSSSVLADPSAITRKIKSMQIRELARAFIRLETEFVSAGDAVRSKKATELYYAILSQILNPALVREKRSEIIEADGEPDILLIPCHDRAILELIFSGIDGRTVAFAYQGVRKSLVSRNEISLDDLPEEGIEDRPDEVAEFLRERLRLDRLQLLSADSLPAQIRTELDWRREEHDCVFAVIKSQATGSTRADARPNAVRVFKQDYAKIILVDMSGNLNASMAQTYRDALHPISRNALRPESSP